MTKRSRKAMIPLVALCIGSLQATAQDSAATPQGVATPVAAPLYDEIARMDAAMFDAFNAHDLGAVMSLFSEKLEFYHDTGGLQSYRDVAAGFKKIFDRNDGIRRDLVKGSLEVYPIKDYGAIEVGAHRFCHVEGGRDDCGTFRFLHVWKRDGAKWKVTRVVSSGHA